jgi:hypothetical protein
MVLEPNRISRKPESEAVAMSDDYSTRQARMDREYIEAGGDAPNHWKQFPQKFSGGNIEDVAQPEVYGPLDDMPEPDFDLDRVQLLREVFTVLETGEPHLMAARLEALKLVHRISGLSIRDAAKKAGCTRTTLHRITRRMGQVFQR